MSPLPILLSGLTFILCLFIHAALWRLRPPARRPLALLCVFVLLAPFIWGLLLSLPLFHVPGKGELLAAGLLQLSFASAYILSYPAFEALSPSLVIVLLAGDRGGVALEELPGFFSDDCLLGPRIRELVEAGMVLERDGSLSITRKGKLLAACFVLMRSLLGLPKGGG